MNDHNDDTIRHSNDDPNGLDSASGAASGDAIGPYVLRERIGVGGMGEVWRAQQSSPIQRTVAIKLIKAGMDSRDVLARFDAERQALALMDHPSIAKVYDAGTTEQGRPYFAMEYVQGSPIVEYCDRRKLSTRERLALFQQVCYGVQHAHQKAVLHRDLKPSNILVTDVDGQPLPKIIDFGVAKAISRKLTDETMYTSVGQLIGTPEYMSPEQAELTKEDVDTRTDVYSLGVILYELLVGSLPFESKDLRKAGLEAILKILREQDPPRPSTKLTTRTEEATKIAQSRRTEVKRLTGQVRGDLDWIVLRALEKDRNRRYGSPAEFAQDVQRHLDDEPVLAGPPTVRYRMQKFVRRHRAGVAVASAAVLGLIAFAVVATYQANTIARERDRATAEADKAAAMNEFLQGMLAEADPWAGSGRDATVVSVLDAAVDKLDTAFEGQPDVEASMRTVLGTTYLGLGKLEPAAEQISKAAVIRLEQGEADTHEFGVLRATQAKLDQDRAIYVQAATYAADAARIFRNDPAATPEDLLNAYHHEARNLLFQQKYAEAESVLTFCEEIGEGAEGRLKLVSAQNFSLRADLLAMRDGNAAAAESLSRRAYERALATDPDSPVVVSYMNNIAQYHSQSGDYEGALADFDSALVVTERILGKDHPLYATCVENRGGVLYRMGRPEETLAALEQVHEIRERNLGPDHIDVVRTTINMGTVASLAGDQQKAIRIFSELMPTLIEARGTDHPDVVVVLRNWGTALMKLERYDEALEVYGRGLETAQRMYPEGHPRIARAMADHGIALFRLKRYAESEKELLAAYAVDQAGLGADHPTTRSVVGWLAKLYDAMGREAEAKKYRGLLGE